MPSTGRAILTHFSVRCREYRVGATERRLRKARVTTTTGKSPLARRLDEIEKLHGPPDPPPSSDPFALVLWENVAYLTTDEKRRAAFRRLKREVGLRPKDILGASPELLYDIASAGIKPEIKAGAMREAAEVATRVLEGDLRRVIDLPVKKALTILKRFPSIGEPGAEKILLFSRAHPLFALESNGLRVLLRLGYGREHKSYSTSYRSVRDAVAAEIPSDCDGLIRAHQLLRRHGQEICKRSLPLCESCPLQDGCAFFLGR
jgi:endonuclease-3